MLEFSSRLAIFMLLVSSGWDYAQSRPIKIKAIENIDTEEQQQVLHKNSNHEISGNSLNDGNRAQRQVVAPTWLNPKSHQTIDSRVHVTAESLREAEAIRKEIQKSIDEGTFAVDTKDPAPPKSKNTVLHPAHHPTNSPTSKHSTKSSRTDPPTKSPPKQTTDFKPNVMMNDFGKLWSDMFEHFKPKNFALNSMHHPTNSPELSPTDHETKSPLQPDVPTQTTDFNPNNMMNDFGEQWSNLFEQSKSMWKDKELWSEIKSHWFDLLDDSQTMLTELF